MSCRKNRKKPFFATGYLIEDYSPLMKYWELLRAEGREELLEKAFLNNEDYELLKRLARERVGSPIGDIFDELIKVFEPRVDAEAALRAFREAGYKHMEQPAEARRALARILAGWLLEAGENLKIIGFSGRRGRRVEG